MVIPCLCLLLFEFCTAHHIPRPNGRATSFLVDIPMRWEPRAKQQPTGLIAYSASQSRPVLVLYRPPHSQTEWSGGIFLGRHSYALGTAG